MSLTSIQFWHCLLGDGVGSHRLLDLQDSPPSDSSLRPQVIKHQSAINSVFPPTPWIQLICFCCSWNSDTFTSLLWGILQRIQMKRCIGEVNFYASRHATLQEPPPSVILEIYQPCSFGFLWHLPYIDIIDKIIVQWWSTLSIVLFSSLEVGEWSCPGLYCNYSPIWIFLEAASH